MTDIIKGREAAAIYASQGGGGWGVFKLDKAEVKRLAASGGGAILPSNVDPRAVAGAYARAGASVPKLLKASLGKRAGAAGYDGPKMRNGVQTGLEANDNLDPYTLRGRNNEPGVVDQMMLQDPIIGALEGYYKQAANRAPWSMSPSDGMAGDQEAARIAIVCREAMKYLSPSWTQILAYLMEAPMRGAGMAEIVPRRINLTVRHEGSVLWSGPFIVPDLKARPLRTVEKWLPRDNGNTYAVQQARKDGSFMGEGPVMEPRSLVRWSYREVGWGPEGRGLLRTCWAPATARLLYRTLERDALHRGAYGFPVLTVMRSAEELFADEDDFDEALRQAQDVVANMKASPYAYATMPEGFELQFVQIPISPEAIGKAMRARGVEMAKAWQAGHVFTGDTSGTEALMRAQVEQSAGFAQMLVDELAELVNRNQYASPIRLMVEWNWGPLAPVPEWLPGIVPVRSISDILNDAVKTAAGGLWIPSGKDGAHMRIIQGLPEQDKRDVERWDVRHEKGVNPPDTDSEGEDGRNPDSIGGGDGQAGGDPKDEPEDGKGD